MTSVSHCIAQNWDRVHALTSLPRTRSVRGLIRPAGTWNRGVPLLSHRNAFENRRDKLGKESHSHEDNQAIEEYSPSTTRIDDTEKEERN